MCAGMRVTYVKPGNVFDEDDERVSYHQELGCDPLRLGDLVALMGGCFEQGFHGFRFCDFFFFLSFFVETDF